MFLPDYPPDYIPRVEQVHPILQNQYFALYDAMETPRGLLKEYPFLNVMLAHNLAFLGKRPIMLAHNLSGGPNILIDLLHSESSEFQAETPLGKRGLNWRYVDGKASSEAVDVLFFGGLLAGVLESGTSVLNDIDLISLHLALQQIASVHSSKRSPKFEPFADHHIRKVVHPDEGKNQSNYAIGATQAPRDWDIPRMTNHYKSMIKPRLRVLRDSFGGVLPKDVAEAINRHEPNIPSSHANPTTIQQYTLIYQAAYHGDKV